MDTFIGHELLWSWLCAFPVFHVVLSPLLNPAVLMPILTEYARFVAPGPTHCHGMLRAACHVLCMLPVPIVSSGFMSALDP